MTKSITIIYNEADESLLMAFFKRLKVKTQVAAQLIDGEPASDAVDLDPIPTKSEFLAGLQEAIDEVKAAERGEIVLPTLAELLAELEEEAVMA